MLNNQNWNFLHKKQFYHKKYHIINDKFFKLITTNTTSQSIITDSSESEINIENINENNATTLIEDIIQHSNDIVDFIDKLEKIKNKPKVITNLLSFFNKDPVFSHIIKFTSYMIKKLGINDFDLNEFIFNKEYLLQIMNTIFKKSENNQEFIKK